jgi:chemotaxis protein histidine kinase CheA
MDTAKFLGIFIEEANEHLITIEQGLLDLRAVMDDEEKKDELFRAAHSIKGGAGMLGYESIRKVAHKLEDCFGVLRDNPIAVDKQLENLFDEAYTILKDLLDRLQNSDLSDTEGNQVVQAADPKFRALIIYLNGLLAKIGGEPIKVPPETTATPVVAAAVKPEPPKPQATKSSIPEGQILQQSMELLKQMLVIFKQPETAQNRQELSGYCQKINQLNLGGKNWQLLLQTSQKAIVNNKNNYLSLAPLIIRELKQGLDLLSLGSEAEIIASNQLQQLANIPIDNSKQLTVNREPVGVAKAILQNFNKQEITQIMQLIHKAMQPQAVAQKK